MSAVIKEVQKQEQKTLIEVLVINDQLPVDFYTNKIYDVQIDNAIELSSNLVYTLDDEGEKQSKTDATNINKFATMFDKFIAATYKQETEAVAGWRDAKKAKTKKLLENRKKMLDQFIERRTEKLNEISTTLDYELVRLRTEKGVKPEFCVAEDLSSFVKLTGTLTDKGNLTSKAKDFIAGIVAGNLAEQNRIEGRLLLLENRCLRADINPPLTKAHFGTVFYADEPIFNEKMEELIETEIQRRAEMEARIIKQQEAQKQKEIDEALRLQQAEANRLALENVSKEQQENKLKESKQSHSGESWGTNAIPEARYVSAKPINPVAHAEVFVEQKEPTPEELRASADKIEQSAQYADRSSDRNKEFAYAAALRKRAAEIETSISEVNNKNIRDAERVAPVSEKRTVQVTATFNFENISPRVSNQAVADFFIKQLPEKLAAILEGASGENV